MLIRWNRGCPPDWANGEISQFVQDDEVEAHQVFGQAPGAPGAGFSRHLVDQVHDVKEAARGPVAGDSARDGDGDVDLALASPADQHHVALLAGTPLGSDSRR